MEQERKQEQRLQKIALTLGRWKKGASGLLAAAGARLQREGKEILRAVTAHGEEDARGLAKAAASLAAVFSLSLCASLAVFPLRVYPAGFSLLSALGGQGLVPWPRRGKGEVAAESAYLFAALTGVLFSCAFLPSRGFFYLLSYLMLFLVRGGLTRGRFDEGVLLRVTYAASFGVLTSLALAALDGFVLERVVASVSYGVLTPFFTYLLCGFYLFEEQSDRYRKRLYREAGFVVLTYLSLYALRGITLFSFSLSVTVGLFLTLWIAQRRGPLYGAAMGMVTGMAADSALSSAMALSGFFGGLFFEYSTAVAVMCAFLCGAGYSLYADGFVTFERYGASLGIAAALYAFCQRLPLFGRLSARLTPTETAPRREATQSAKKLIRNMSEAFSSLSQVFYTVGESIKKPPLTEVSRNVTDVFSRVCSSCPRASVCWGEEQSLHVDATGILAAHILDKGRLTPADFPDFLRRGCPSVETLTQWINARFADGGKALAGHKTGLLAGEYSAVSRLLKSTAGEIDRELEYNAAMEERARRVLERLKIQFRRVAVFGTREIKIDVYGVRMDRIRLSTNALLEAFEKEFDCLFDEPYYLMFEESVVLRLRRRRRLALECAKSGCAKRGETVNGDVISFFETDRHYFYTLICDGMGSGREAAFTSRLASLFIEKLLRCATPKSVTLEMLNSFLMAKTDETFSTVDLLEIDLFSSVARFIKAGASPSYVLRRRSLACIESRTPPAGVLDKMCAEQTTYALQEGDFVILLSDGADEESEKPWILSVLTERDFATAAELCDAVFEKAKEKSEHRDDLSVCVLRILPAREDKD